MKISVIGSTGGTGLQLLQQGIQRGHQLTAFARKPELLAGIKGLSAVVQGNGLTPADVRKAVAGQDCVVVAVNGGTSGPTTVAQEITRNVIAAMQAEKVRRLLLVSTSLHDVTGPWGIIHVIKWGLRHALTDSIQADRLVRQSGLDWTIVRATKLTDKPAAGRVRRMYGGPINGPYRLTRGDLAAAILDSLERPSDIGWVFGLSGAK